MKWQIKFFEECTNFEWYAILRLRSEVFVVEQNCVYQDIDNKDQTAIHLFAEESGEIVAYARIFKAGDYFDEASIGRVVVKPTYRGQDLGHDLMKRALEYMNQKKYGPIHISAQEYLKKFYETHGFRQVTEMYLEDGIPHIGMQKTEHI